MSKFFSISNFELASDLPLQKLVSEISIFIVGLEVKAKLNENYLGIL
jgi:hypothetical protein